MATGAERIAAERQRQIEQEGWTPQHDDEHANGELLGAALAYAVQVAQPAKGGRPVGWWPKRWAMSWWKPSEDPIRNLEKAGALIAAEIDRQLRARERADA